MSVLNASEIFQFAIRIEENGEKFYRNTAENLDVSQNKDALNEMKEKTGQLGAPVIDIDGKIITGFDKEKILQEIGI